MKESNVFELNEGLRKENLKRIEVLEKVKELNEGYANQQLYTIDYLVEYFECLKKTLEKIIERNKLEIQSNGMKSYRKDDLVEMFLNRHHVGLKEMEPQRGKTVIHLNSHDVIIPNRGLTLFTKRSILNLAMLFTENEIALSIRSMLLDNHQQLSDIHEKLLNNKEITIEESNPSKFIDEELEIQKDLLNAIINGDVEKENQLKTKLIGLKGKHIQKLESENIQLKDTINKQDEEIKEVKEFKQFMELIKTSDTSLYIGDFSKLLSNNGIIIGRNNLFRWLVENKYISKVYGHYSPNQIYISNGYLEYEEKFVDTRNGVGVSYFIKVTKKGQLSIAKKLFEQQFKF